MKATGYEAITVSDTAIGFTTAKIAMAAMKGVIQWSTRN